MNWVIRLLTISIFRNHIIIVWENKPFRKRIFTRTWCSTEQTSTNKAEKHRNFILIIPISSIGYNSFEFSPFLYLISVTFILLLLVTIYYSVIIYYTLLSTFTWLQCSKIISNQSKIILHCKGSVHCMND